MEEEDMDVNSQDVMDVENYIQQKEKTGKKLTRGDKSRIAAKFRRDKESVAFNELIRAMPLCQETLHKLDKTSVIRLAIMFFKIKHFLNRDMQLGLQKRKMLSNVEPGGQDVTTDTGQGTALSMFGMEEGQLMMDGLNGFLIFVNKKGNVKFVSPTICDHLGLKMEHLIGHSVLEIIHPSDKAELMKQFGDGSDNANSERNYSQLEDNPQIVFYVRMKYNLVKPGTKSKQSGYMLVQWSGKMKHHLSSKTGSVVTDGLLCICRPMQTTSVVEIRMDGNMFMSRHDLSMTFTYCDSRIITLIGYDPSEVIGKTAYHFHNPIDAPKVSDCHQKLIIKGNSVSKYYRFLGKTDNWVWLQTRASIIYNTNNKPQYIVCMNYVISEEEGERYLMLEEHKHANTHYDNVCLTLPDNQGPHFSYIHNDTGPSIIELNEENLEKTACLNGQLDNSNRGCEGYSQDDNRTYQILTSHQRIEYDSQTASYGPFEQNFQTELCGAQPQDFLIRNQSALQHQQPVCNSYRQRSDLLLPTIPPPVSEGHCQDMMVCSSPESAISTLSPSPHDLYPTHDQPISSLYSSLPGSCHSNNSYSEDGGYESATSPYGPSYTSSSMVSPGSYNCSSGSDRGFTPDGNTQTSFIQGQNCNFGVGYSPQGASKSQTSHMFDASNSQIPEAESILDELLKSLNNQNPSNSLEDNMATVYSTIENIHNVNSATVNTHVQSPSVSLPPPSPVNSEKSGKEKSLLRSFLTMPENDIPKSPFMFKANQDQSRVSQQCNRSPKCQSRENHQESAISRKLSAAKKILSANSIDIDLVCKTPKPETAPSTPSCCPVQTPDDHADDLDLSNMPDDISDFALQYLDSVMNANAEAVISGLTTDTFMDTSESDLTQEFLSSLENQCQNPNPSPTQHNSVFGPFSGTMPSCYTTQSQRSVQSFCSTVSQNGHAVQNGQLLQSHDHVYHQSRQRGNSQHSSRMDDKCNESQRLKGQARPRSQNSSVESPVCSTSKMNGSPACRNSQTQTSMPRMSELERVLRCNIDDPVLKFNGNKSAKVCSSPRPFLQQLLTGELTKDRYMEMEKRRCSSRDGQMVSPP